MGPLGSSLFLRAAIVFGGAFVLKGCIAKDNGQSGVSELKNIGGSETTALIQTEYSIPCPGYYDCTGLKCDESCATCSSANSCDTCACTKFDSSTLSFLCAKCE